jgi:hypothetical protein
MMARLSSWITVVGACPGSPVDNLVGDLGADQVDLLVMPNCANHQASTQSLRELYGSASYPSGGSVHEYAAAGIQRGLQQTADWSEENWDRIIATNLTPLFQSAPGEP